MSNYKIGDTAYIKFEVVQFSKMGGQDIALVSPDGKNAFPIIISSLLSRDDVAGRRTMEVDAEEYKNGHYRQIN